jgi:hypothetical protein
MLCFDFYGLLFSLIADNEVVTVVLLRKYGMVNFLIKLLL